ncbi:gamma-glutamyltransferase [Candidatus Thiosymbion oneisti]|uniref:gamma-glutamyltransferase n=1 Tax=Candidatus Thiosymbion oneisti TaxID=589554 RepID=UPI000ACB521E|nr:gamma-glutamyltransferase [Candidatus Thiosymbion oneisti]
MRITSRTRRWSFFSVVYALLLLTAGVPWAATSPPQAAIASAHPLATEAGFEILTAGGNAFDAAVAVSAALAVVEPYSSGLGGGGFWLLHRAEDGRELMLDGRERAPLAAHRDMYLDAAGRFVPGRSLNGPLAAGIPGEPAALVHLTEHYGRLPLAQSLTPAIRLAHAGFAVDERYRRLAQQRLAVLLQSPAAAEQFLRDGEIPPVGTLIVQPDLADTLERLANAGRKGFYAGRTARLLIAGVRAAGGIWTPEDLASYRVVERTPIVGHYRGWRVVSAAPPSSGGVLLVQMLNMLSGFDLTELTDADRAHLLVEVMRRAYRDRALYLGDPDAVEVPVERLTHPFYAAGLARDIDPDRATPSRPAAMRARGADTTHFSILDQEGNRVAATLSINYPFGSGFVPPGTGVLLNDEMDDFSAQPGVPNVYGLIGGEANAIAPGKRMLSSMTPTFAESERGLAVLGTPGGSRIITMVLQGLLSLDAGDPPAAWVAEPRFHHQYLPDRIQYEPEAFSATERHRLEAKGHRLHEIRDGYGNMQAIYWDRLQNQVRAVSDPRGIGKAEVR